jgi:ABC-type nitrate/sulfonate/bicarbonate transport system permease component
MHLFRRAKQSVVLPTLFGVALLLGWEMLYQSGAVSKLVLSGPSAIVVTGFSDAPALLENSVITLTEALTGYVIGNTIGLLFAVAFIQWNTLKRAVFPLAILCEAIPVVAILPMLIIWLGSGMGPKIFIAAFLSFFPMLVNAYRGLNNLDEEVLELLHSYSAASHQVLWLVRLPAALPFIFSALRLSACGSMISALVAEWVASQHGLGYLIVYYSVGYRVANVWAAAILACLISLLLYGLVGLCEKLTMRRFRV